MSEFAQKKTDQEVINDILIFVRDGETKKGAHKGISGDTFAISDARFQSVMGWLYQKGYLSGGKWVQDKKDNVKLDCSTIVLTPLALAYLDSLFLAQKKARQTLVCQACHLPVEKVTAEFPTKGLKFRYKLLGAIGAIVLFFVACCTTIPSMEHFPEVALVVLFLACIAYIVFLFLHKGKIVASAVMCEHCGANYVIGDIPAKYAGLDFSKYKRSHREDSYELQQQAAPAPQWGYPQQPPPPTQPPVYPQQPSYPQYPNQ